MRLPEARRLRRPRLLAPEVVQSSAMDCGPAALACLLGGFGIATSYDRLREACQTDLDGTSIDTLEAAACRLGLEAEQIMLPPDSLPFAAARALPAILVIANPLGFTHFVVAWRRLGPWIQVMDPAVGRRWVHHRRLLAEVYLHSQPVPAAAWREWAGSAESLGVLEERLARLGLGTAARRSLLARAAADPGWEGLAGLEAASRLAARLVRSGALAQARAARRFLEAAIEAQAVPDPYWSVRPGGEVPGGEPQLLLRGAVLVRALGRMAGAAAADRGPEGLGDRRGAVEAPGAPELAVALAATPPRPAAELARLLLAGGRPSLAVVAGGLVVGGLATVVEVLLFRGFFDLGGRLVLPEQRALAAGALLAFLLFSLALDVPTFAAILSLGRHLEIRLRATFLAKVARLPDRYFRSRLASDMAERCHQTHKLREASKLAANALRWALQGAFTVAGILWLSPATWPLAFAAAGATLGLPLLVQPLLTERDLRLRSHAGALSRFYLDALLGLVPARNHGAERALRREHEGLLGEWVRALLRRERAKLAVDLVQAGVGYGLAVWLVAGHLRHGGAVPQVLLLAFWALNLQTLGQQLVLVAGQYPQHRNVTLRLLEPLRAEEGRPAQEGAPPREGAVPHRGGAAIAFEGVEVVASGHTLLAAIEQRIAPGSQVAIVGPSGAGKSSLVGLLLGWHRPAAGRVIVDGRPLDEGVLEELRAATAWVDPSVQLWNRPLLDNLLFGSARGEEDGLGTAVAAAELREVLESLPEGLRTPLGEGGALVSGGEGQRVRLGRALLRRQARLVILDEPFRGLQRELRRKLAARARRWWAGATLLYVTHDVEETLGFDRVLVVEGGRIREAGSPREMAMEPGSRYASLLAAVAAVRESLAASAGWRRLRMEAGSLRRADEGEEPVASGAALGA